MNESETPNGVNWFNRNWKIGLIIFGIGGAFFQLKTVSMDIRDIRGEVRQVERHAEGNSDKLREFALKDSIWRVETSKTLLRIEKKLGLD